MVGVAGLLGAALARDLQVVEGALRDTRSSLEDARAALATGNVDETSRQLEQARRSSARANARVNRVGWRAAEQIPLAGRTLRSVGGMVDIADETARLGRQVVQGSRALLGPDGGITIRTSDGRIPLEPLREAHAIIADVDTARLRRLVDELDAVPGGLVPAEVAMARASTVTLGREVAETVDKARDLLTVLPRVLGADGPRRYFLAMQNPAELRGTGGLIGFHATVDVADGRMELSRPEPYEALDDLRASTDTAVPSGVTKVPDDLLSRYADSGLTSTFSSANLHPDLPATATVVSGLFERSTGQSVDGVIVVDPLGLSLLLEAVGPVEVPANVAATAPSLPNPVAASRVPSLTMVDVYEAFRGRNSERRAYLREFASTAFDGIFDARWDGVAMATKVGAAISRGHLAVVVDDDEAADALARMDADGALAPPETDRDHLAITANNVAGNKLDAHAAHRVSGTITLTGDRALTAVGRRVDIEVELDNPFDPTGRAPYIAGSFPVMAFADGTAERGEFGLNRTWFSVWLPGQVDFDVDGKPARSWQVDEHSVTDRTVEASTGETASFEVSASGIAPVTAIGDLRRYILEVRRQPKAITDSLDLDVVPPPGWVVHAARVEGGGSGAGTGPGGPEAATTAAVTDGRVRVTGDVNADLAIVVDLQREDDGLLAGLPWPW